MTKLIALAFATLSIAGAASLPAEAATRMTDLQPHVFANRCLDRGGELLQAGGATLTCVTPEVAVACEFRSQHRANCAWDGGETRAVARLIGAPSGFGFTISGSKGGIGDSGNGGGGKGGGFDLPDLPIDNGGGGGGIDLPDLPINNG